MSEIYEIKVSIRHADDTSYSKALTLETRKEIDSLELVNELLLRIHQTIETADLHECEVELEYETLNPGGTE
jgi:hypothetical protein